MESETKTHQTIRMIDVDLIDSSPFQARQQFNRTSLIELADQIDKQGLIQPVVVRFIKRTGRYELVAGERRWRAVQIVGWNHLDAIVRSDLDDVQCCAIGLTENIQRETLTAIEIAEGLKTLKETSQVSGQTKVTDQELAATVGKSRSYVTNALRLLACTQEERDALLDGSIKSDHALALLGCPKPFRSSVLSQIIHHDLNIKATRQLVDKAKGTLSTHQKNEENRLRELEISKYKERIEQAFQASVSLVESKDGSYQLRIDYSDLDHLDGLTELLERIEAKQGGFK